MSGNKFLELNPSDRTTSGYAPASFKIRSKPIPRRSYLKQCTNSIGKKMEETKPNDMAQYWFESSELKNSSLLPEVNKQLKIPLARVRCET